MMKLCASTLIVLGFELNVSELNIVVLDSVKTF